MNANVALRVAVGILIVAVIGLGVALFLVASSLSDDVDEANQTAAQAQTRADKAAAAKPPVPDVTREDIDTMKDTLTTEVESVQARLGKRVKHIEDCVPEIQAQIDSLDLDDSGFYITNDQQVSRVCQTFLYGRPLGD